METESIDYKRKYEEFIETRRAKRRQYYHNNAEKFRESSKAFYHAKYANDEQVIARRKAYDKARYAKKKLQKESEIEKQLTETDN